MQIPECIVGKITYVAYNAGSLTAASEQAGFLRAAGEEVILAAIAQTFEEAQNSCRQEAYDLLYVQC